jgi:copper(I)-binding protein
MFALALAITAVPPAGAEQGTIVVEEPWARATPPGAPSGAGYLSIRNAGPEPDRLVAAASPRAARVELHRMTVADGVARMRPVTDGLEVPPGAAVALEPGGLHLMFRELDGAFAAGQSVPVTLSFERAGEKRIELPVVPLGAGPPAGHGGHSGHDGQQ